MGGCSSKPKTADFEGVLEVQEDKPQNETPRKSLEAENVGLKGIGREQESSGRSIQTVITEREQDDLQGMFAEADKQMIAGFSTGGNFQEERQVLEDDSQHVKEILAETVDNLRAEKGPTLKEEILKLQINPEVVSDSKIPSLEGICISSVEDSSKLEVKTMGLHDGILELSKNLPVGGKEILKLQKGPSFDSARGLQEDARTEASSKGMVESEFYEAVSNNEEQRLDDSLGHKGQDNQFGEESKECGKLCKEAEVGACEVVNTASGTILGQEGGEDVLKDSRKPRWEDGIKGLVCDEAAEKVITGTFIIKDGLFPAASDQEPSRGNHSNDAVHSAITTDVSANSLQHVGDEQDLVQEEQEANVDATCKVAVQNMKLQADNHRMNGFIVKESNVETLDTTHGDGDLISMKSSMNDKHVQMLLENTLGEVQEKPYAAEGQPKADASCTPDELTASQVITTTKKPEAQSVHVMEFAELALIPAQDIAAPDIDEVWEKLATEFERQESLARGTS